MTGRVLARCVLAGVLAAAAPAFAQAARDPAPARSAERVRDAWVDAHLADIDRYGKRYGAAFDDELVRYQDAPRALVEELQALGWPHGRRYAACAIARAAARPCRAVVQWWQSVPDAGWGEAAAQFDIDAARLARIREGIAASYARWGRPPPSTDATTR